MKRLRQQNSHSPKNTSTLKEKQLEEQPYNILQSQYIPLLKTEKEGLIQDESTSKQAQVIEIGASPQVIQNCDLQSCHDNNVLYSNGKRSLVLMNLQTQTLKSSALDDERIVSSVYHPQLDIYLINTEKRLMAVNSEGELIYKKRIPELLQAKYLVLVAMDDGYECVQAPNTRRDLLIFTTNQYMYRVPIQIKYERSLLSKNSKSLCSLSIEFLESFTFVCQEVGSAKNTDKKASSSAGLPQIILFEWVENLRYLSRINMLVCWNPAETFIFQLPKKTTEKEEILLTYDKISKKSSKSSDNNKATSYEISLLHRLLLVSFQMGSIKAYKLDETKKYVCELRGHQRQCTSLLISSTNYNLLYSVGLDNTIRVWDLIDLTQVYQVRLDLICARIEILNERIVFARSYDKKKTYLIQLNMQLLQPILLSEQKNDGTKIVDLACDGEWGMALYSNNLVEAFLLNEKGQKSREFNQKIEFPIKYGFLRSSVKLQNEKYGICMEKGLSILKLNKKQAQNENFYLKRLVYNHSLNAEGAEKGKFVEIIHQKLLGTYFFTILHDWKNIPIAITVTSVSLILNETLPKWDLQTEGKALEEKRDYVILGTERGYIYFVDLKKREFYYTRVGFHSNHVTSVQRIETTNNRTDYLCFLSMSRNNQMAIWSLSRRDVEGGKQAPKLFLRTKYTLDISVIKIFDCFLAIGCKGGQFSLFRLSFDEQSNPKDEELLCQEDVTSRDQGHLKCVTSIDYLKYQTVHLFITGSEDQVVKIWLGLKKQLIFQLKIFNYIHQVVFLHQGIDFMFSHGKNSQISLLRARNVSELARCQQKIQQKILRNSQASDHGENELQLSVVPIDLKEYLCPQTTARSFSPLSPFKRRQHQGYQEQGSQLLPSYHHDPSSTFLLTKKRSISEISPLQPSNESQHNLKKTNRNSDEEEQNYRNQYLSKIGMSSSSANPQLLSIAERKKKGSSEKERYYGKSRQKTSDFSMEMLKSSTKNNGSIFLPKLPERLQYKNASNLPKIRQMDRGELIMQRLGHTRVKSFSLAGRRDL